MSLRAWEQEALDSIEGGLAGSDHELISLLATFARLASGEDMPVHEEIRMLGRRATRRPLRNRRPRRGNVHRDGRSLRLGWQQTILLVWLAVTIALVPLVLSRGSGNGPCTEAWGAVVCTQQAPAHSPRRTAHNTAAGPSATTAAGSALRIVRISSVMVLANANGLTLYWFAPDTATTSACSGTCASYWPPVRGPATAGPGITNKLATITRSDGSVQATYDGHPLYTYVGDGAPGQANGNELNLNGGLWHEVTASSR